MNMKQNKYKYEFAREADGAELSALLEESSFDGDYDLVYAKIQNAYDSVAKDSENFRIAIARNSFDNKICGMGVCNINKMLVKGKEENIAYLSGFRRKCNVGGNIIEMYKMLGNFCKDNNVKYTYTTILEDNIHAKKMLTKKRKAMPDYIKISDYTVYIFKSNLKTKNLFFCEKANENDLEKLKIFVKNETKNKTFFPYIDLDSNFFGLSYKDFYLLKNNSGEILACGILWNQTDYKQLVVKKYSIKYKIIRILANFILNLLNYPILPNENETVNYSTLSFVLYKDANKNYLNELIREISHKTNEKMFVYASTKELSEEITPMKYKSNVYIVDWNKDFKLSQIDIENLYIECALL